MQQRTVGFPENIGWPSKNMLIPQRFLIASEQAYFLWKTRRSSRPTRPSMRPETRAKLVEWIAVQPVTTASIAISWGCGKMVLSSALA